MARRSRPGLHLSHALTVAALAGCARPEPPFVLLEVRDEHATLFESATGARVEGSYLLDVTRPEDSGDDMEVIFHVPGLFADNSISFDAQAAVPHTAPVPLGPGESISVPFTFTGDAGTGMPTTGWPIWCSMAPALPPPQTLRVSGTATLVGEDIGVPVSYQTTIALESGGEQPAPGPPASAIGAIWTSHIGGIGSERLVTLAPDGVGGVLVTGDQTSNLDLGDGALESGTFAAHLSSDGDVVWSRALPLPAEAAAGGGVLAVAGDCFGPIDLGGGPLTEAGSGDVCVARLADDGSHVWSARFGDAAPQNLLRVAAGPSGELWILGTDQGTTDFGGGPLPGYGGFLVKLDADGAHLKSLRLPTSPMDPVDLAVDAAGNVVLTGTLLGPMDFGGGPLAWNGTYPPWVVKLDTNGEHVWSRTLPSPVSSAALPPSVTASPTAELLVLAGDVYRLATDGAVVWQRGLDTSASGTVASAAALDGRGNGVVVGSTYGGQVGATFIDTLGTQVTFVARVTADGTLGTAAALGCGGTTTRVAWSGGPEGGFALGATFHGFFTADDGPIPGAGAEDAIVVSLAP